MLLQAAYYGTKLQMMRFVLKNMQKTMVETQSKTQKLTMHAKNKSYELKKYDKTRAVA